jgi:hypothetical protein
MSPFALVSLRRTGLITLTFLLLPVAGLHDDADRALVAAAPTGRIRHALAGLPLSFEPNLGQADPRVKFLSRGRGYTLFLTKDQAILAMQESGARSQESGEEGRPWSAARGPLLSDRNSKFGTRNSAALRAPNSNPESPLVLRLRLLGANAGAKVTGMDELPGKSNYFIGKDPKKWHTHIPTYGRVRFASIYPGVDLVYYGEQNGQLEYDFVLAPGADPRAIQLAIAGPGQEDSRQKAVGSRQKPSRNQTPHTIRIGKPEIAPPLRIAANGDLIVAQAGGDLRLHKPVAYQVLSSVQNRRRTTDDGQRTTPNPKSKIQNRKLVDARYVLKPDGTVTFEIGPYDRTLPLVIDPVLSYSTFLGGSDMDYANGVAVDASGNAYITGYTASVDFPVVSAAQSSPGAGSCLEDGVATPCFDAFVSKLNPSGTALVYSTYLGGSDEDYGAGIAVDSSGDAYVAGYTYSTNFPVQNALQPNNAGGVDAFVTELSAGGDSLIHSTYWGGSLDDVGTGIAVDSNGNAYLSGYTESTNLPVTSGAFQTTYGNGAHNGFVVKFNSGGAQVGYSTYLGGSGDDYIYAAAVDSAGDAYVTGATNSTNFPTLNAFQPNYAGGQCAVAPNTFPCYDAFAAKLNPAGSALLFSTYLGGTGSDYGYALALDSSANVYLTGYTTSVNFPTTPGAFQRAFGGAYDVFVTKLNDSGSTLAYSTYLGGSGTEVAYGIAVDSNGSAYTTGYNYGGNFPTANPVQARNAAFYDAFVNVLDPTGSFLVFSTYLGGTQDDFGRGIALDPSGNIYVVGATFSTDFPTTSGSFEPSYMGGPYDAFVTKYNAPAKPVVAISPSSYNFGSQAVGTASSPEAFDLTNTGGAALAISSITASGDFSQTNNCGAGLASGGSCTISVTFTPSQTGARSGAITVSDNASPATQTISLTGTGTGAQVNLAPSSLTFSPQLVGTSSSPQNLTLSNTGTATLKITSIAVTGDFSQTNTCGSSVAAGAFCTISVTFKPTGSGQRTGTVTVTDNASPTTQTASLTGTGAGPGATLSPASLTFATQAVGTNSSAQTVTLKNTGTAVLTISSITISGDFSQTHTCSTLLAVGSSCSISVTFKPTASGTRTGVLSVSDNAVPATQTVSLTGTGAAWQQAPGSLSQISVGSDGTVWGLSSAGQPYMFNSQTQTWQQAPGLLTQITVASNGVVWGLNAAGQIYRYDASSQGWDQIPGILSQLVVGSDGDVWGMNSSSQIYHFNAATQTWVQIPGALAQLAVGYDGAVWGINASQQVYRFNPGTQTWQQVAGFLKQVVVGADGDVWGINSAGQTFHFNTLSQQWENTGASLAQLAVGSATNVWGLDAAGGIWCFNGQEQAWSQVPGQLAQIAVGENGAVWGLNSAQQIYQFAQPTQPTQTFHARSGSLAQVVTGLDGEAWGIDGSQQVWHFDALSQSWQQMPGGLRKIAVGFGGNVWGLNAAGQIWRFNPSTQGWGAIPGLLAQLACGADGSVWGLGNAGQIWRFNSSTQGFQQISGSLAKIAVGADGTVWGLNSAGQIFRFNSATQGWGQIPGSLSQIAVGSANNVWGINATGQVFRYDSKLQSWDSIPGILTSLAVAFDGTVWGLNSAQEVWRYNVQTQSWDSIAGQMSQISVGADAVVWGLDASGQTYEYW